MASFYIHSVVAYKTLQAGYLREECVYNSDEKLGGAWERGYTIGFIWQDEATDIYKAHSTTMLQAGISSLMEYRVNFGVNLGVCTLWMWACNDNPLYSLFLSSIETEVQKVK